MKKLLLLSSLTLIVMQAGTIEEIFGSAQEEA
jgi:hypothetical protein